MTRLSNIFNIFNDFLESELFQNQPLVVVVYTMLIFVLGFLLHLFLNKKIFSKIQINKIHALKEKIKVINCKIKELEIIESKYNDLLAEVQKRDDMLILPGEDISDIALREFIHE